MGHPDDVSADRHEPTLCVLSSVGALGTEGEGHNVARAWTRSSTQRQ
ncbi:MAG: hypothetical protein ABI895_10020 [Deltaproteobacteria bacterium]